MNKPNIIFIMSDDHAANAISAYNSRLSSVFTTPNLDSLAEKGCLLTNCHCTNSICTPSRACMLTGQYPHKIGVKTLADKLDINIETFPVMLQESGYQTALFGKWHVHSEPQGFDEYAILPSQGKYFNPDFIYKENSDWTKLQKDNDVSAYPKGAEQKGYVTDIITDYCIDWLENRNKDKPFLLLCHHKAPHDFFEYHPRDEHILNGIDIPEPKTLFEDKSHRSDGSRLFGSTISDKNVRSNYVKKFSDKNHVTGSIDVQNLNTAERTKAAYQKYLKDYLRTVKAIDDNVGRLMKYIDENNLGDDTIIIYTSDQGMFLGEHDYLDKRWIYEESLTMPFIVRYPKEIKNNLIMDSVVSNVDFAPTILDYAGIAPKKEMQGKSLKSILKGIEPNNWENISYNRYWMNMAHHDVPAHYGIRTKKYKLIYFYGLALGSSNALDYPTPEGWELYDIQNDKEETTNLYNNPEYAEIIYDLKQKLKDFKDKIDDPDTYYPEMLELKQGLYRMKGQ